MEQQSGSPESLKRSAARFALNYVKPGMVVGLGSGSTSEIFVQELGILVRQGGLPGIIGVATSEKVERLAQSFGVQTLRLDEVMTLDVTIDGADEIEPRSFAVTKGRGGALLREKLVAVASKLEVIIADESKLVTALGEKMPTPVEIISFGWQHTAARLRALGCEPTLRLDFQTEKPFLSDSQNFILDCRFGLIKDPVALGAAIKQVVGVVEHGIFTGIAGRVVIAAASGVYEVTR